jgi:xanthine dehydrogenase accessory factor
VVLEILQELMKAVEDTRPVALVTIVAVDGAAPAQLGFQLLVYGDGSAVGNVGGGELEAKIRQEAQMTITDGRPRLVSCALREEGPDALGMLCGGRVTAFIDPYAPKPTMLIVGGGHVGRPLAEMARIVGYDVHIIDAKSERASRTDADLAAISKQTYVVIMTENHISDEAFLRNVLKHPFPYVGMIGSQRKVGIIFDHLRADGYAEDQLAQVHAPIGLDLGGRQPSEIALAILAEVEAVRHGGSGQPRTAARSLALVQGHDETR